MTNESTAIAIKEGSMQATSASLPSAQNQVLRIDADYVSLFYSAEGEVILTISPEGFSNGVDTVDIGTAGVLFSSWVADTAGLRTRLYPDLYLENQELKARVEELEALLLALPVLQLVKELN